MKLASTFVLLIAVLFSCNTTVPVHVVVGTRCEHPRAYAKTASGVEVQCRDDGNGVLRWRYTGKK